MDLKTERFGVSAVHSQLRDIGRRLEALGQSVGYRMRLLRQPRPDGVSGPPPRLLLGELRDLVRRSRPAEAAGSAARPRPVLLIPGFFAHPKRMRPLHAALDSAGHHVSDWGLGINMGPSPENFAHLLHQVDTIYRRHDAPVALIGWSLGGLYAREVARQRPEKVSCIITMGTPFSGDPHANNAWRFYQAITGHAVDEPPVDCAFACKPPVRTIALWSPRDGVIHPRSAAGWPGERDEAVALRCTHLGFAGHASVIAEVLRQLDRDI